MTSIGVGGLSPPDVVGPPRWVAASLNLNEGRDPLGLQTTTQDRLMPLLMPGLLELSRRARYFSFHAYLLDEYRRRGFRPDPRSLSTFVKRREWDLGLAIQRCPLHCGSSPVGSRRLGSEAQGEGPLHRGESVESALGGYGLYYRTPLIDFGIVARAGTMLGNEPIPIDVLRPTPRAQNLAQTFRDAVANTEYHKRWMDSEDEIPASAVDELAEAACLCGLDSHPVERGAIRAAIFDTDDTPAGPHQESILVDTVSQRKRSVAHYLSLVRDEPTIVDSEGDYRQAVWAAEGFKSDTHRHVAGQWAAVVAKDVWQEALCSIWFEFCARGLAATRALNRGLDWDETRQLATALVSGTPTLDASEPTPELAARMALRTFAVDVEGDKVPVATAPLEALRRWTETANTASSGLVAALELHRRMKARDGGGWAMASHIESGWQPSVAAVMAGLDAHLASGPTVGETLWWIVSRFVVPVHERIAYSKLPEFTFRFRWEDGLLRFQDHGVGRFPLAAIRHDPLASLTYDLGYWTRGPDEEAKLTNDGLTFLSVVFE